MNNLINKIKSDNSNIEYISINNGIVKTITENQAIENKKDNIYFLGGVKKDLVYSGKNRAKEIDIVEKNYCVIDLDIRKNFLEKYNESLSDDNIMHFGFNISETLKDEDDILADFDFIVFSGNGLHIYYFGDYQNINPDDYSFGVKRLYNKWNKFWGDEVYHADPACKNISRILRLPGSINQKNGKPCKIIFEKEGKGLIFNKLKELAKKEKLEEEEKRKMEITKRIEGYQKKEKMNSLIYGKPHTEKKQELEELFNKIDNIPAYLIAQILVPKYKLNKNGKNFDNDKKGYTGYFYVKDLNCICNGGSRYFNDGDVNSCYSPSILVKNFYDYTWSEVIKWFKDKKFIN